MKDMPKWTPAPLDTVTVGISWQAMILLTLWGIVLAVLVFNHLA